MNITPYSRNMTALTARTVNQPTPKQSAFLSKENVEGTESSTNHQKTSTEQFDHRPRWQKGAIQTVSYPIGINTYNAEVITFDKTSTAEKPVMRIGNTGLLIDPTKVDPSNCTEVELAAYCCYLDACMYRDGIPVPFGGTSFQFWISSITHDAVNGNKHSSDPTLAEKMTVKKNWLGMLTSAVQTLLNVKDYGQYLEMKKILDYIEKEKKA